MHGSDLQQGDVQRLEQSQAIAPRAGAKRVQPPSQGGASGGRGASGGQGGAGNVPVPEPMGFLRGRLQGTRGAGGPGAALDPSAWMPFIERLASSPRSSSGLAAAFIAQASNISKLSAGGSSTVIDRQALDDAVEAGL